MRNKKSIRNSVIVGAVGIMLVSVLSIAADQERNPPPRDVTMTGKIVDLHCFMTDKFESSDKVKCTRDCINAGVPAALETEDGLVLIGQGPKGVARTIAPLAFETAELKGKLYEKHGLRYIDITSAKLAKPEVELEEEDPWDDE